MGGLGKPGRSLGGRCVRGRRDTAQASNGTPEKPAVLLTIVGGATRKQAQTTAGAWTVPANGAEAGRPQRRRRAFSMTGIPKGLSSLLGGKGGAEPWAAPMVPQTRATRQPPVRTGGAVAERRAGRGAWR